MVTDEDMTAEEEATAPAQAGARHGEVTLDKRGLLKRIVASSGIPAPQARRLLDATLAEIAAALDAGAALSLPPLGKLRPVRTAHQSGKSVHTLRLRRAPAARPAEAAEGDDGPEVRPAAQARARAKAGAAARRGAARPAPGKAAAGGDEDDDA